MKKRVLFCATVDSHILNFHVPYLQYFKEKGYEVHVATGEQQPIPYCDKKHVISIKKSPVNLSNLRAYSQLKKIIIHENFQVIHCHTPMGGALARLAARSSRQYGTKVLYTAHGFHFYQGAPLINWLVYYPVEKWLARYTDCLITINTEDYNLAQNRKFNAKCIEMVNGVGVNLKKFKPSNFSEKQELKKIYGYSPESFILMYVAELNKNKNQSLLLKGVIELNQVIPHLKVVLIGTDYYNGKYQKLAAKLKLIDQVDFFGQREDVDQLLKIADAYVATSIREGLPVNVIEAMATGVPVCATKNRGHSEIIQDEISGSLIHTNDISTLVNRVLRLYKEKKVIGLMAKEGINAIKKYELETIKQTMDKIYSRYMNEY